jgi:hypothetical protein
MVERGSSTSFAAKAFERLWVFGYVLGKELQRDKASQLSVLGFVYDAHPSTTEFLDNAVMRDGLPDHSVSRSRMARELYIDEERKAVMLGGAM